MTNFWQTLPKPFLVLAPMEDVTDVVFREIVFQASPPDVFFTEFTSCEGLFRNQEEVSRKKLTYTENQRPIVAQIWGNDPQKINFGAKVVAELGFDGLDINMGCPDRAVVKQGCGAALIDNQDLAKEMILAAKEGAPNLPLSVKTRIGFKKKTSDVWFPFLLEQKLAAISVHFRTGKQMSDGEPLWEESKFLIESRNQIAPETTIIGNGDVLSYSQALEYHQKFGVDGVMIGRGIFADPWVFDKTLPKPSHTPTENLQLLAKHVKLYDETWGKTKNFEILKKFFKIYVHGFDGASELRAKLMNCHNANEVFEILNNL